MKTNIDYFYYNLGFFLPVFITHYNILNAYNNKLICYHTNLNTMLKSKLFLILNVLMLMERKKFKII